ncbi:lipoprotein-anchoring transpeptidase ErfK/SrfK [Thermocatellispora tengchongensis]|uniref:Lipoprotein-anchoring transpeptidase ErfK/SrfK n=1 Tax=Thermocatellispora tengchongensis TaxID=1073253 RepID=A0A840PHK7_9ACTN|nr:Ig-like domain-containing protein [Thermocatellispora tengchongensis]MBB5137020.1 lipoprotein-anchoring transpeptidase ErfK/SrfK [Thermocatellispora tengchongensis]
MHASDRRWRAPLAGLAVAVGAVVTAGCSGGPASTPSPAAAEDTAPAAPAPTIKVSPADGSAKVRPDKRVVVVAEGGTLEQVSVTAGGKQVEGGFDESKTRWVSKAPLMPSTSYTVTASATGAGGPAEHTSTFKTLKPERALAVADVTPNVKGEKVGVGAPIIVTFNQPVSDKAAVEKALIVKAEKPVPGAWRWVSDTQAIYRTAKYWPAHQKVLFSARLAGVRGGKDMYGVKNTSAVINIGAKVISTVDTRKHTMVVKRDGKTVQKMLISAGKATTREYTTTSGVHLTMERANPVRMISPGREKGDPEYYDVMINHAVRISNSGEYVHAKDNVWAQGRQNVSHGCINARPDQAKWFYDNFQRGDVVIITGTDRELEWNNGWGFWQMSFKEWKKGSAL